jgi:hypothetical protein
MRLLASWTVGVALACLWAGPARTQNVSEAVKLVPEDAPSFALVNRVGVVLDWFEDFARKQHFPVSFRKLLRKELGFDKGVDEKGDLVVVIYLGPGREQSNVFGVPITDYKEFLQGLKPGAAKDGVREITLANGEKMLTANRGKYALLAQPEHAASLKKVLASSKSIVAATRPLHRWLAEISYALVLTPRGLKEAQAEWRKELGKVQMKVPAEVATFVLPLLQALDRFLKSDEITYLGVGARLAPAGDVAFRFKSLFKEGSAFARAAGNVKPLPGGPLAGLPAGPYALAFGGPVPGDLSEALIDLEVKLIEALAANPDRDKMRALEQASLELGRNVEGLGFRVGRVKESEPLSRALVGVLRVRDASTFLAAAEKAGKASAAVLKDLKGPLLSDLKTRQVKSGKHAALEITARWGRGLEPAQKEAVESLFGAKDKMTATLLAAGAGRILVGCRPVAELVKMLPRDADRGLADDPQTAITSKLFTGKAQWVLFMNPREVLQLVSRFQKDADVMRFPDTPPVGMALRLSSAGADLEMVMPTALVATPIAPPPPAPAEKR